MPFTQEDWLPSYEELTVPEITMSAAPLKAASHHMGRYCDYQCKEYMLCMNEEKDPRKCLNEGKEVTRCGLEFLNKVKNSCADEFTKYWDCLDFAGHEMDFRKCRKTQALWDKCVLDHFGQERPERGYFAKVRLHKTSRERPDKSPDLPEKSVMEVPSRDRVGEVEPDRKEYGSRETMFKLYK